MNDFYVYLHRKLSDGRVFYVGKGRGRRAYRGDKSSRSDKWLNTANKYGWRVEIVFDNLSEEDAYALEVDTILEMKYFNEPLVNHNDGGRGGIPTPYTEDFGKRVSEGLKKHFAKHGSHHKGKDGLKYWENGRSNDLAWVNLELLYKYYSVGLRYSTLSRVFPEISKTVLCKVCDFFEKYGDPKTNVDWVEYSNNHPSKKLVELPSRAVSKMSCYLVIENIEKFNNLIKNGHGTKFIAKNLNIPISTVGNMFNKIKKGYNYEEDPVMQLVQQRLRSIANAEDLEEGQDD